MCHPNVLAFSVLYNVAFLFVGPWVLTPHRECGQCCFLGTARAEVPGMTGEKAGWTLFEAQTLPKALKQGKGRSWDDT